MKLRKHVMLKRSPFFHVELKEFSLFGAQPGMDEEFEGTSGELFHPAYGRAQGWTIESRSHVGSKGFLGLTRFALSQLFYDGGKRRRLREFLPFFIGLTDRA